MSWRYKWSFLHMVRNTQIQLRHFASSSAVSSHLSDKTHKLFSRENVEKVTLTPQIVHATLLNCSSDLIALSFFIWCAKQHNYFHSGQAFDYMVGVVSRLTDRYMTVGAIVKELESVGIVIKAQTFLLLLRIYWRGGMYSKVFETFEQMGSFGFQPNTFAYNVLMDVFFKIGHVDAGITVLKEIKFPNFLSYSIALSNLCKLNDLVNVKDVLQRMLMEGYYPNVKTLEMVLNCCCKLSRLLEALQLLGFMITLGVSLSVNTWSMLISGLCRLRQPVMASHVLERMVKSSCSPNVVTYTILFKGFVESGMITSAFGILKTMQSKGHVPDLFLCNVLIHTLSKIGRYDDALAIFLGLPKWNLVPDSYTFASLLSSLCYSRRFNLLPELISGVVIEADLVLCNSLLNYFCKAGFPHQAVKLYDYMIDNGIIPDNYSFVGLLRGLCGERRVNDAVNVYLGMVMKYTSLDAHVHSVIIHELFKIGRYHKAIRLFRRAVEENYPIDAVLYTIVISGLVMRGRIEEASGLYKQMKELSFYPNAQTYNIMLYGFCVERDIKKVKILLQEIIKVGFQLDYNTLIRLSNFLYNSCLSSSPFNQLVNLWNLGLMPNEVIHLLLFGEFCHNVKFGDANKSIWKRYLEENLFVDSYSSDDLPDAVASLG